MNVFQVAGLLTAVTMMQSTAHTQAAPPSGKYWVYFGTNTGGKSASKGIYRSELDLKTGKLAPAALVAEVGNPSFVNISPDGKTLYCVGETTGNRNEGGGVYAFRIDPKTGALTKLNALTSGGAGPCHISTDASGKHAVVSNYGGGSCAFFTINDDGSLAKRVTFVQHTGKSVDPSRQKGPHTHSGFFDATGKYCLVADLGLDKVIVYEVDPKTGAAKEVGFAKMPPGSGPRHTDIAASNDLAFVCGEMDCTANVVKLDFAKGKYEVVQSLSTLPSGKAGKGDSTAEVRIHPNGKFVYVSNRGHNSIAEFKWDGKKLTAIGHATEGINIPRNFNIDPTGRWMIVANQDGNDVVVFEIDATTGKLTPTGNRIDVPKPICVKFLARP